MSSAGAIASAIVAHYGQVKRDLPWRRTRDPYAIWVSEIMLQQTRVATVIPYWERWMARFPTVRALADAPLDDVLAAWAGLGYYSRARNLRAGAQAVTANHAGALPRRAAELRAVPGIGPYTAGAIASIAYGERTPLVDGNVARVLGRVFAIEAEIKSTAGTKALWARAGQLMDALPETSAPGDLNQGLMELGASLCSPTSPRCLVCPVARQCEANRTNCTASFPVMRARKKERDLPRIERSQMWIECDGSVLLARRIPEGLFGGLWELPSSELAAPLGVKLDPAPVAHHDQTLTHRRMSVTILQGHLSHRAGTASAPQLVAPEGSGYDALAIVKIVDAAELGVASATIAILTKYQDTPWTSTPKPSRSSPKVTKRSSKRSASSGSPSPTTTSRAPRRARPRGFTS